MIACLNTTKGAMTFHQNTLSIKGLFVKLNAYECHYTDCRVLIVVILSAVMLNVALMIGVGANQKQGVDCGCEK
jgi:hypothetical protein